MPFKKKTKKKEKSTPGILLNFYIIFRHNLKARILTNRSYRIKVKLIFDNQ